MDIIKLKPACMHYIWGGNRLITQYHKVCEGDCLAESWELSCHSAGASVVASGSLAGKSLPEYIAKRGNKILGKNCERFENFPILIKFIDAKQSLSVQVHPADAYALKEEGEYGKTEMWYVVDCEEGAYLYFGFQKEISEEELRKRIADNTLTAVLEKVEVKKGDVFFIEAGTIHAIGAGILIAEIQQNSNLTYRVYDFGRVLEDGTPRELHTEKAIKVINRCPACRENRFYPHIGMSDYFVVDKLDVLESYSAKASTDSFHSILILEGSGKVISDCQTLEFQKGESIFIEAGSGDYRLEGCFEALLTTVPPARKETFRIGIDLGGTNIKVGIVDENNKIIARGSTKTLSERPWQEIAKDMVKTVHTLLQTQGIELSQCISCGIGSPGIVDAENGIVAYSNNLDWHNVPLVEELKKEISLPIYISNDANCAALGEAIAGAAKGCKDVVLLTLGTGVGGGVVVDGKVFEGGAAGGVELGHTVVVTDGELCTCGRKGCLEAYTSATALIRDTKRAAQKHPESLINVLCQGDLEAINGETPFAAAQKGDVVAQEVVDRYIFYLGEGIVNFVNIFRPEKVLLSGGVCNQGEALTKPLREFAKKYNFGGDKARLPEVGRAQLGNDAGIIGAAWLGKK